MSSLSAVLLGLATLSAVLPPYVDGRVNAGAIAGGAAATAKDQVDGFWGLGKGVWQRTTLQNSANFIDVDAAALDGEWDGEFIDPTANTVRHMCLSEACQQQFPNGKFTLEIKEGGTEVDWVDIEIGGRAEDPSACEADGLADVERPSGFENVKGKITSYEGNRMIVSVSPKEFTQTSGSRSASREGSITVDPFEWCIKFGVFVDGDEVRAELRLFEDNFEGTLQEWREIKSKAENFQCLDEDIEPQDCMYDISNPSSVIIKRAEVIELKCKEGACLDILNSK